MQLVEHDALERRKQKRRVVGRQQQRQLLRRGEQDVRRIAPLPLPPRHRGVAGAGLDLDRQPHLGDRRFQIARDIDRQRLQRRDVEGVEAAAALHAAAGGDDAAPQRRRCLSPPPARVARGGEGSGVGGVSACSAEQRSRAETPPTPDPSPPLRGGRGEEAAARDVRSRQLHQRRQKSGQRLAGAGRRDQQRRAVVAGFCQQRQLMLAGRPAAAGEPAQKRFGQQRGGKEVWFGDVHSGRLSRSCCAGREPKTGRFLIRALPRPPPDRAPAHCPRCGPTDFPAATA